MCSLVPKPPPFFVLWFAFSIIHRSGTQTKEQKWGRPGNEAKERVRRKKMKTAKVVLYWTKDTVGSRE